MIPVKEIRLIEAEIAKIDQDIADTLAINKKLEQQYQEDIIKLAKMWKKQQVSAAISHKCIGF